MRKSKIYIVNLLFVAVALLTGCGESLEDTYSDYAGDGRIRYVARCTSVYTTPGWERLLVTWVNGTDATTDKIKVVWTCEDRKDTVLLPGTSTSYEMKCPEDGTYRFDICAVDKFGNESLWETTYGRPYTREHEVMRAFTRGVVKSYFLEDKHKMIFFSDQWNENIVEMKLQYKNTAGEIKHYEFKKGSSYKTLVTIDDVSMAKTDTVYVLRKGKLEGSLDTIPFDPYAISRKKNFSAGFEHAIESRYGYSTGTKELEEIFLNFIETTTDLELDYDMETLEDILYCSNLKRLIVGKNRYLHALPDKWQSEYDNSQVLKDPAKSYQVIAKASEVLGLKVHYYGNETGKIHYFNRKYGYMEYEGYPQLPTDLVLVSAEELKTQENGSKIRCTPEDPYAKLENLLDDNDKTRWETTSFSTMRTHEMYIDLVNPTEIRGIKVTQIDYAKTETGASPFMPSVISIQTSADGAIWKNLTRFESNPLGRGVGEVTLLQVPEGSRKVRSVRIVLHDRADKGGFWMCKLGDIMLYK